MLSGHGVGTYEENELTHNSSGNTRPQSSQLKGPGLRGGTSTRDQV